MPQEKSRMKLKVEKKPTIPCKSDKDCGKSQSCHAFFGCVDNPHIPATVTTAPQIRVPKCKNSTECPDGQYCHDFFNLCLPNLTIFFETTASPPRAGCKSDSDCENQGDFCHNLTRLCLPLPTTAITSPPRKSAYACNSHTDCKMTEFCHFLIGMRSRDKSRGFGPNNNLKSALGVCIARALKDVPEDPSPFSSNCSHAADCGKGRCCLKDLGLCVGYRLPGELCVAEVSPEIGVINSFLAFSGKRFYAWLIWPFYLSSCLNISNAFYNTFYSLLVLFCEMMSYQSAAGRGYPFLFELKSTSFNRLEIENWTESLVWHLFSPNSSVPLRFLGIFNCQIFSWRLFPSRTYHSPFPAHAYKVSPASVGDVPCDSGDWRESLNCPKK